MQKEQVREQYKTFQTVWFIALVALAAAVIVGDILLRLPRNSIWRPPLYAVVIIPLALILLYLVTIRPERATWSYYGITAHHSLKHAGVGIVLGLGAVIVALVVTIFQFGYFPNPREDVLMHMIASGIAAPLWEELLFRGMLFASLLGLIQVRWQGKERLVALLLAYVVINVLFLTTHIGTSNLPVIYLTGFFYLVAFHMTGSLFAAIAAHSTYNLILEAVALFLDSF
ncbi:MAG: CPBP family intramembrane glutamic endopeptidase [Thermoplasmatota archaeon]